MKNNKSQLGYLGSVMEIQDSPNVMVISLKQTFHAKWKLHAQSEMAAYEVHISIEGPERSFMTDVAPIVEEIRKLEGEDLSSRIGRSSLEAIALHIREIAKRHLDVRDRVKGIKLIENGFFTVSIGDHD